LTLLITFNYRFKTVRPMSQFWKEFRVKKTPKKPPTSSKGSK